MPLPLSSLQAEFAAAVRAAGEPVPPTVTSHTGPRPKRRFDVYRNNVYASLINVLEGRFPVTARIVGEEFFRAMARVYAEREPPRSPVLLAWGAGFPDFIATFEPAQDLVYLPDVARLEWARQAAYHAADATPLEAEAFADVAPDATAGLVLALHPSAWALDSRYPIVTIWEANSAEGDVGPIDVDQGESALVLRPHLDVNVHRIPDGGAAFVTALAQGLPLGAAYAAAHAAAPGFDLAANLAGLIRTGAIAGFAPAARRSIAKGATPMSVNTMPNASHPTGLAGLIAGLIRLYERLIPSDLIALLARFIMGMVFWLSGMTKIDGFSINSSTFFLFANEYKIPLIPPDIAAYMATITEITCPLLLWAGFASRFAATAMLIMTLVIEIFVFPEAYVTHGQWAVALLFIMMNGPGTFSIDHLIRRRYMGEG